MTKKGVSAHMSMLHITTFICVDFSTKQAVAAAQAAAAACGWAMDALSEEKRGKQTASSLCKSWHFRDTPSLRVLVE